MRTRKVGLKMEMHGQAHIAADRQKLWDRLTDPAVRNRCLEGLSRANEVGVAESASPERLVLTWEGGSIELLLAEAEGGTLLTHILRPSPGDDEARTGAGIFVQRLKVEVERPELAEDAGRGVAGWVWIGVLLLLVLLLLALLLGIG